MEKHDLSVLLSKCLCMYVRMHCVSARAHMCMRACVCVHLCACFV